MNIFETVLNLKIKTQKQSSIIDKMYQEQKEIELLRELYPEQTKPKGNESKRIPESIKDWPF